MENIDRTIKHIDIIVTLGPSSESHEVIKEMAMAGANTCRVNLSHANSDKVRDLVTTIRRVSRQLGNKINILLDLKGRKMRLGRFPCRVELKKGQNFILTEEEIMGGTERASVSAPELFKSVSPGNTIFLSDRRVELLVEEIRGADICCRVQVGGFVDSGKGVNIPTLTGRPIPLSAKDRHDLDLAMELEVDQIYLSFVRGPYDIRNVKEHLAHNGASIPVWPKIENAQAVAAIEEILEVSDGICVARGDLGTELPPEELPFAQKRILGLCRKLHISCSMGGQVMDSMTRNPIPLRAEVCDVANAVIDGADAIILSDETSVGRHPVQAVNYIRRIVDRTVKSLNCS